MPTTPISDVLEVASKAAQLGPFLFAVLFLLVVLPLAYKFVNAASTGRNVQDAAILLKNFLRYFWLIGSFAIILVIVSVIAWFKQPQPVYYFEGVIQEVKPHETIVSRTLYFRPESYPSRGPGDDLRPRDMHFIVRQHKPFDQKDHFDIGYSRGERSTDKMDLTLRFRPHPNPKFEIEWNETDNKTRIIDVSDVPEDRDQVSGDHTRIQTGSILLGTAFAFPPADFPPAPQSGIMLVSQQHDTATEEMLKVLRQEGSDVPDKIAAIDQLEADGSLKDALGRNPLDILVLLDLTRHSDRELAYKVRRVTEQVGVDALLVAALSSPERVKRETAETILFRIERGRAERILREVSPHKDLDSTKLSSLLVEVKSGKKERLLIPTASPRGDRYYVKAEWASGNQKMIHCLAQVFREWLKPFGSLEEQQQIMSGHSTRYGYNYSKSWALGFADAIEKCGAKATFVGL